MRLVETHTKLARTLKPNTFKRGIVFQGVMGLIFNKRPMIALQIGSRPITTIKVKMKDIKV